MKDEVLLIPASLAQAIHDYLITRPMKEVEGYVVGLRGLSPLVITNNEPKPGDVNEPK